MDTLLQDLRYAVRLLLKSPGFSLLAIVTLALGIGANTAIFSVVYSVLLRPLPYPHSDRIVQLREKREGLFATGSVSYPNYLDWRAAQRSLTDLALYRVTGVNLSAEGEGEPERITGARASFNTLSILGVRPVIGRDFVEADDKPGVHVALIGDKLWRTRFGANRDIVGRTVTLSGVPTQILGVLPAGMEFARAAQVLLPLAEMRIDPDVLERGNHNGFSGLGRLKDGVSLEQARADFNTIARNLEKQYPDTNARRSVTMRTLLESGVGDYRSSLYVLFGAVGCVLLIACANVAGLLLARGTARQRELGIRSALGANRFRLTTQLLIESLLLSVIGGAAGVLLAIWGLDLILALSPADSLRFQATHLNTPALIFTSVVAVGAGLLAGAWPAWRVASSASPTSALHEGGRGSSDGVERQRLRAGLVVCQVALALVLLSGAGLLLKSFWKVQEAKLGFDPDQLLLMRVTLPTSKYSDDTKIAQFTNRLLERVRGLPGVTAAASAENIPFDSGEWDSTFHLTGTPQNPPGKEPSSEVSVVSADYFKTMKVPLRRGRFFGPQDKPGQPRSIIIDESLAKRFFPNQDPIGKQIDDEQTLAKNPPPLTIVGVVGRVRTDDPTSTFTQLELPQMYFYTDQYAKAVTAQTLIVRVARGNPLALTESVKRQILEIDPDQPVSDVTTMEKSMASTFASRRLTMTLTLAFAGLALVLAAVGLFGVMALRVTQRTREIGIRLALGAQRGEIFRLVIGNGLKLAAIGVVIGLCASLVLTRALSGLLYGVGASDPLTMSGVILLLGSVTLLANFLPARKATQVDPMVALRED